MKPVTGSLKVTVTGIVAVKPPTNCVSAATTSTASPPTIPRAASFFFHDGLSMNAAYPDRLKLPDIP